MKKQYTIPRAQAVALQAESMLATSMDLQDGSGHEITTSENGRYGAWTQRKRNWSKSSPWETDEE